MTFILVLDISFAQELFIPDTSRWEMFLNEDFNSPIISLSYYTDNNCAKKEGEPPNRIELPALLMDSNVYIQNGNLVIKNGPSIEPNTLSQRRPMPIRWMAPLHIGDDCVLRQL